MPTSVGFDALDELDHVDWLSLHHAYGQGVIGDELYGDVARSLAVLREDPVTALRDGLRSNICHQGTVYEATAYALPFIAAVAAGNVPAEVRAGLTRPGAWPWRSFTNPDDYIPGEPTPSSYFWVLPIDTIEALDDLLQRVAEDEVRFIVTDAEMTWIFAPYDGGCDVFLPDGQTRDELEAKHPDWLPGNSKRL